MESILITGGTGLIGKKLTQLLLAKGYQVFHLSRSPKNTLGVKTFLWNISKKQMDEAALKVDYIVHLAGAGITDQRWTNSRKKELYSSRIDSLLLLKEKLQEIKHQPKALIAAGGVGYYGLINSEKIFTEEDPSADDYLGNFCSAWEAATEGFDCRTVILRTGVVLGKEGGALPKLIQPVKMGIGSALGSGKQCLPWIHIDDIASIYLKAIEDDNMQGVYNAVAPEHITNEGLIKNIAQQLNKPFFFPKVPSFIIKLLFGEMSEAILRGSSVSSEKIIAVGFEFNYPGVKEALKDLLPNNPPPA